MVVETSTNSSSGQVDTQTGIQASDSNNNVPGNPLPGAVVESQAEVVAEEKTGDTQAPASTENGANDETKGENTSAGIPPVLVPLPDNNDPLVPLPVPVVVAGLLVRSVEDPIDLSGGELPAPASPSTGDPQVLVSKPVDPKVSTGKQVAQAGKPDPTSGNTSAREDSDEDSDGGSSADENGTGELENGPPVKEVAPFDPKAKIKKRGRIEDREAEFGDEDPPPAAAAAHPKVNPKDQLQIPLAFWTRFNDPAAWRNGRYTDPDGKWINQSLNSLTRKYGIPKSVYIAEKNFHIYDPTQSRTYKASVNRSSAKGSSKKRPKKEDGSDDGEGVTWSSSAVKSNSGAATIPGAPVHKRKQVQTERYEPPGPAAAAATDYSGEKYSHHTPKDCQYKVEQFLSRSRAGFNLVARIHFPVDIDEVNAELAEGSKFEPLDACQGCGGETEYFCNGCTIDSTEEGLTERKIRKVIRFCLKCHTDHVCQLGLYTSATLMEDVMANDLDNQE